MWLCGLGVDTAPGVWVVAGWFCGANASDFGGYWFGNWAGTIMMARHKRWMSILL